MNKILIIGCPGSGKSTFARQLHAKTGIPVYYLDRMFWNEDKTTVDSETFQHRLWEVLQRDRWILDGNYSSTMEIRLKVCDTLFFLDYPLDVCLEGILVRRGKKREDMLWVEDPEDIDEEFLEFVRTYPKTERTKVLALLKKYADKEIVIFRDRKEAQVYLENIRDS